METEKQLENPKGSTSLVKKFSGSCSLPSLVNQIPGEYPKELLSNRLSGSEFKEAILIHLLGNIRMATPEKELPKWILTDLVSSTMEDLMDRWNFLLAKSKRLTLKEKRVLTLRRNPPSQLRSPEPLPARQKSR